MFHFKTPTNAMYPACRVVMNKLYHDATLLHENLSGSGGVSKSLSVDDIFQCLSVANLNAHSYYPNDSEPDRAALFPMAAIIAHSCQPNCIYSIHNNSIEYYAIKEIKLGESITSTYLSWDHLTKCNTLERRLKLQESKDFYCMCMKCRGIDYSRGINCNNRGCCGVTYSVNKDQLRSSEKITDSLSVMLCSSCGVQTRSYLRVIEKDLSVELVNIIKNIPSNIMSAINDLEILATIASQQLSPTHSIVINVLLSLVYGYVEVARTFENSDYKMTCEYLMDAVMNLVRVIRIIECIDSECQKISVCHSYSYNLSENNDSGSNRSHDFHHAIHPPSPYNVPHVMTVCTYLNRCHQPLPDWILSYLPLLQVFYGESNSNVKIIKRSFGIKSEENDIESVKEYCKQC